MALPTYQDIGTAVVVATAGLPLAVAWPTHQADDIALLIVESEEGTTVTEGTSGWVEVADSPQGGVGAATQIAVFWKRAAGAAEADASITAAENHAFAVIMTFRGCIATGDPWDVTAGDGSDLVTEVSIPGDTTTVADCLIVAMGSTAFDSATGQFSSWANADLANVTERANLGTAVASGGGIGVATGEKAVAGLFGATTATLANAARQGHLMVALKPPAAGGFTPTPMMHHMLMTGGLM